jgi:hypothetical protein
MTYQDPYQPGYGQQQQPGYDPTAYPQQPGGYEPPAYNQPYSGAPVTPAPVTPAPGYQAPGYPNQGYQQPGYATPQYAQPMYVAQAAAPTNTMAILSLVFAFVFAPLAIVFGHMARKQIRERGEQGEGLATAGLVVGYIFTGIWVVICGIYVALIVAVGASGGGSSDYQYLLHLALGG